MKIHDIIEAINPLAEYLCNNDKLYEDKYEYNELMPIALIVIHFYYIVTHIDYIEKKIVLDSYYISFDNALYCNKFNQSISFTDFNLMINAKDKYIYKPTKGLKE